MHVDDIVGGYVSHVTFFACYICVRFHADAGSFILMELEGDGKGVGKIQSEFLADTGLFQCFIGRMAFPAIRDKCEIALTDRTIPDFMIALALPHKFATIAFQQLSYVFVKRAHDVRGLR